MNIGTKPAQSYTLNQELADYILSYCSSSPEARAYALTHIGRLVRTIEITPPGSPGQRLLEMGAYMQITPALKTKCGYGEVRGCYLGPIGVTDHKAIQSTQGERFECEIDLFNAESDVYPYPDGHFKTVVCCELLEHLADDPMHLLAEVNRILEPNGHFVLSTPNICALRAVAAVLEGRHPGLFGQFTIRKGGNQVEPRHAREYTPNELTDLYQAAGFVVDHVETGPYGEPTLDQYPHMQALLAEKNYATDLRDEVVHLVGRKAGPVQDRYPAWLYL